LSRPRPRDPADEKDTIHGIVKAPVRELATGKLRCFSTRAAGKEVRFMLLKQNGGAVSSALDACEMCGAKGYRQSGRSPICTNCAAESSATTLGHSGGRDPRQP